MQPELSWHALTATIADYVEHQVVVCRWEYEQIAVGIWVRRICRWIRQIVRQIYSVDGCRLQGTSAGLM
jgi:hypothetical protein